MGIRVPPGLSGSVVARIEGDNEFASDQAFKWKVLFRKCSLLPLHFNHLPVSSVKKASCLFPSACGNLPPEPPAPAPAVPTPSFRVEKHVVFPPVPHPSRRL